MYLVLGLLLAARAKKSSGMWVSAELAFAFIFLHRLL
jgi:hypothetical protein